MPSNLNFEAPSGIKFCHLEHECFIGAFSYAVSGYMAGVTIGRYCSFGESIQIGRQNHPVDWVSTSPYFYLPSSNVCGVGEDLLSELGCNTARVYHKPSTSLVRTEIGNDVWIGHGAMIKAGVSIGSGAIVAAGSVVVKDVEPYSIVGGNPARHIRFRIPERLIGRFLDVSWWRFTPKQLMGVDMSLPELAIDQLEALAKDESPYEQSFLKISDVLDEEFCN